MNQAAVEQAVADTAPATSPSARNGRPTLRQTPKVFRMAVALASGLISLAFLGAVALGITAPPDRPSPAGRMLDKDPGTPAAKAAPDAADSVPQSRNPL